MKICTSTTKKLNPDGLHFWDKPFVMFDEIEAFAGGVVDYPTVAMWEAEDRLKWRPGYDEIPSDAYPERVVLYGYVQDFTINSGRFIGEIHEPTVVYDAASLWAWLVKRVGVEPEGLSGFTVSTHEYVQTGQTDSKTLYRYLRRAQAKGEDFLTTGDPYCPKLFFKKASDGRIYFNREQVEILVNELPF
ncbi:MAG: hypothetical protein EOM37_13280 [Proteobacteria bacterium]|nr:hypothetical protein [Pseudomonadota bacterium]